MAFKAGDWVANKKYGVGRVEADKGGSYVVRFVNGGEVPIREDFLAASQPPTADFEFPKPVRAPIVRTRRAPVVDFDRLVEAFLRVFPQGFDDAGFENGERREKREAAQLLQRELSQARMNELIGAGDFAAVSELARNVVQATNLIFSQEKIKFLNALKQPENHEAFARALSELLYGAGEEESRFEQYVSAIAKLDSAKWTLATYFQFLATNGDRMFMKPEPMQAMEASVAVPLEYATLPNWKTYSKLQAMAKEVDSRLRAKNMPPQSGLDVQGFIWASTRIEAGKYENKANKATKKEKKKKAAAEPAAEVATS